MRYEQMTEEQQTAMLKRLYKRLNKRLFKDELKSLPIWISEDINWIPGCHEAWAAFSPEKQRYYFSSVIAKDIASLKKADQLQFLATIMVHEMVHQYCWSNHIDDSEHNEAFREIAEAHGLKYEFVDGEWKEKTSPLIYLATYTLKF